MCETCEHAAPHCTFFETRRDKVKQEAWICGSCPGLRTICRHCAERCHSGHDTHAVGVRAFSCSCGKECTIVRRGAAPPERDTEPVPDDGPNLQTAAQRRLNQWQDATMPPRRRPPRG
jgi:hypothetical protein